MTGLGVALFVLTSSVASGQQASASLTRIPAADVDAPPISAIQLESQSPDPFRFRRVCLREGGAFVFTFEANAETGIGTGGVRAEDDFPDSEPLAVQGVFPSDELRWGWTMFNLTDEQARTCLLMYAGGGRSRLYRLRIGVN